MLDFMRYEGKYIKFWKRNCKKEIRRLEDQLNFLGRAAGDFLIASRHLTNASDKFLDEYYDSLEYLSMEAHKAHSNYGQLFFFPYEEHPNYAMIRTYTRLLKKRLHSEIVRRHYS